MTLIVETADVLTRSSLSPARRTQADQTQTLTECETFAERAPRPICIGELRLDLSKANLVNWFTAVLQTIYSFRYLPLDWDSHGAQPIHISTISTAMMLLDEIIQEDTPQPYVFPTPNGGVQYEWHTKRVDMEIEIRDHSTIAVLYEGPDGEECGWDQSVFEDISKVVDCVGQLV